MMCTGYLHSYPFLRDVAKRGRRETVGAEVRWKGCNIQRRKHSGGGRGDDVHWVSPLVSIPQRRSPHEEQKPALSCRHVQGHGVDGRGEQQAPLLWGPRPVLHLHHV